MEINAWKIVEDKNGIIKTLFHGVKGSRLLPKDEWIKAECKWGSEGVGMKKYRTGFHCFLSEEVAEKYFMKFKTKKNRKILPCLIRGKLRFKPTNPDVVLASEIKML